MPPDYKTAIKPLALQILDDISLAEVQVYYGKVPGYDAKSKLFNDLGIPADYFAAYAKDVNTLLRQFEDSQRVTSKGLRNCATIGDFISLLSLAAGATLPAGEPK